MHLHALGLLGANYFTLPFPKVASWLSKAFPHMNICLCLV